MAREVFYSFHFDGDCWRTNQVRHIGTVSGNQPVSGNDWEEVRKKGDGTVEAWIDQQLKKVDCTVVLIGEKTADREFVRYEIQQSWNTGNGLVGIYIHNLKDALQNKSNMGRNPLDRFTMKDDRTLSSIVKAYNPPYTKSTNVYSHIEDNLGGWVEEAIKIRKSYTG